MSYVVVEDVAASWEQYRRFADSLGSYQSSAEPPHVLRALRPEHVIYGAHEKAEEWA